MMGRGPAVWAPFALGLGVLGLGFSPILVRVSELEPSATAVWRVALALPGLAIWAYLERRPASPRAMRMQPRDWLLLALAGIFWTADLVCWHWAITLTTVANANFLTMCAPFFVALGAFLIYREPITRRLLAGLVLAIGGGTFLLGGSVQIAGDHLAGDALGIATGLSFAAYLLAVKRLRGNLPTGLVMLLSGAFSLPGLVAASLASGEALFADTLTGWLVLLALSFSTQLGGQSLVTFAVAHMSASLTSIALLMQPVLAALLAWSLLGEALTPMQGVGGIIVLAGIYVARRPGNFRLPRPK
jgi:drug/metabolite transporter (DMT)-like permease